MSVPAAQVPGRADTNAPGVRRSSARPRIISKPGGVGEGSSAEIGPLTSDSDKRLSKSLLNALKVLALASQGEPVDLSPPAAGTYLKTWVAVGPLEQLPGSHSYQLAERWR